MREELAALMHEIWGHWMKYLFSQCWHNFGGTGEKDGSVTIPVQSVERWMRQMRTPYDELSEKEKDSDREQADKVLALIGKYVDELDYVP